MKLRGQQFKLKGSDVQLHFDDTENENDEINIQISNIDIGEQP